MLSIENSVVFRRLKDEATQALQQQVTAHLQYPDSEHLTLVRVFHALGALPVKDRSKWCADHFIVKRTLLKAAAVRRQLQKKLVADFKLEGELTSLSDGDANEVDPFLFYLAIMAAAGSRWAVKVGKNRYFQVNNEYSPRMIIPRDSPVWSSESKYILYHECLYRAAPVLSAVTTIDESLYDGFGVETKLQRHST